jgi:hypothetical protein
MNISPTLDKTIPKGHTYLILNKCNHLTKEYEGLKGNRDAESKKRRVQIDETLLVVNERFKKFDSGDDINLYFDVEKVSDISKYPRTFDFNESTVYKISPIAMKKTWQTSSSYETYDLNAFSVTNKFTDIESLMKSLHKDGILKEFVATYFLAYCFANKGYAEIRIDFLKLVQSEYGQEYLPSLYDFFDRFSDYSGANYKVDHNRMKCIAEAYKEGLINLHHPWMYTEHTIEFLLYEKEYGLLEDFINSFNERTSGLMSNLIYTDPNQRALGRIIALCNAQSDNEVVARLMKFMNINKSGLTVNVYSYDEDDRYELISKSEKFDSIEKVKRWLIKNYDDINMEKVMSGDIDGLEFRDGYDCWHKVELKLE